MTIEAVGYIADLNETWPQQSDSPVEGAGHDRVTKLAMKNSFPNIDGPVTLTPDEINGLVDGVDACVLKAGDTMSGMLQFIGSAGVLFTDDNDDPEVDNPVFGSIFGVVDVGISMRMTDNAEVDPVSTDMDITPTGVNITGNLDVTGDATGVTPEAGDSSTLLATTEFVTTAAGKVGLIAILRGTKPIGTSGGQFNSGSWVVREIDDTPFQDEIGVTVALNQITLPEGVYEVTGRAPGHKVNGHVLAWHNVTNDSFVRGGNAHAKESDNVQTHAEVRHKFAISAQDVIDNKNIFELRHQCETTQSAGLGTQNGFMDEVYAEVVLKSA